MTQYVVGERAQPSKDAWLMTDARLIFLEGDVAGVVQSVLDMPVTSDCGGGVACRHRVIGQVVCYLGCAAP